MAKKVIAGAKRAPTRYQSAVTGKFVSATYAKRYPQMTFGRCAKAKKSK